jgi:hypothetical protein
MKSKARLTFFGSIINKNKKSMWRKQINQLGLGTALLITVLSFGSFAGAVAVVTNNQFGFEPTTLAHGDEGDDGDSNSDGVNNNNDNSGDNNNGDNQDSSSKSEKERQKKAEEDTKKQDERARETAKKQFERSNDSFDDKSSDNNDSEDVNDSNDKNKEDSEGDVNEVDGEGGDNAMFKDRDKTLSKLEEKIAEAEKEILEKQSEGADVTAALNRLALAKSALASIGSAFDAGDLESVKRLAQEAKKLTHFARGNDLHDAKKIAEDIAKVAKRIAQVNKKLAELKALGGETSSFETTLAEAEKMFAEAMVLIGNGGTDATSGFVALDVVERRVKNIKHAVANAIFALGGEDDEFDDDHRSEVADFVKSLNDVADIEEGGIGKQVRTVARAQRLSADKVVSLMDDVKTRGGLVRFLFGPRKDGLDGIQEEIAANNARIAILNSVIAQINDADIKAILAKQVENLQQETTNLTSFVNGELDKSSLLAWFGAFVPRF